jgi:single-stranded DNA-binding protein
MINNTLSLQQLTGKALSTPTLGKLTNTDVSVTQFWLEVVDPNFLNSKGEAIKASFIVRAIGALAELANANIEKGKFVTVIGDIRAEQEPTVYTEANGDGSVLQTNIQHLFAHVIEVHEGEVQGANFSYLQGRIIVRRGDTLSLTHTSNGIPAVAVLIGVDRQNTGSRDDTWTEYLPVNIFGEDALRVSQLVAGNTIALTGRWLNRWMNVQIQGEQRQTLISLNYTKAKGVVLPLQRVANVRPDRVNGVYEDEEFGASEIANQSNQTDNDTTDKDENSEQAAEQVAKENSPEGSLAQQGNAPLVETKAEEDHDAKDDDKPVNLKRGGRQAAREPVAS